MTNPPPKPNTGDDAGARHEHGSTDSTPRWAKVFGIIVLVLVLLFVIVMLLPGGHGPGRHIPSGDAGGYTLPIEHGL